MIDSVDEKLQSLQDELAAIRQERAQAQMNHNRWRRERQSRVEECHERIRGLLKRGNDLRVYSRVVKSTSEERAVPPNVIKLESLLLRAMHCMEYTRRLKELVEAQNKYHTNYMLCEISVMEDEKTQIQTKFCRDQALLLTDIQEVQQDLRQREMPQHMVIAKLNTMMQERASKTIRNVLQPQKRRLTSISLGFGDMAIRKNYIQDTLMRSVAKLVGQQQNQQQQKKEQQQQKTGQEPTKLELAPEVEREMVRARSEMPFFSKDMRQVGTLPRIVPLVSFAA